MAKSPQDVAAKWARNLGNATDSIRAGIDAVTTSPTEAAAAAVDRQVLGVQRARDSGKTVRRLRAVSLSDWQNAAKTKGLNRIASGAASAVPKMAQFMTEFLPYVQQGQQKLASMPRGTLDQNIARMVAMAQHNAAFKRSS